MSDMIKFFLTCGNTYSVSENYADIVKIINKFNQKGK